MSDRHPKLLLEDIIESSQKIIKYTRDITFDDFGGNSMITDAVIRNFERYRRSCKPFARLEIKENYPNVNWHEIRPPQQDCPSLFWNK